MTIDSPLSSPRDISADCNGNGAVAAPSSIDATVDGARSSTTTRRHRHFSSSSISNHHDFPSSVSPNPPARSAAADIFPLVASYVLSNSQRSFPVVSAHYLVSLIIKLMQLVVNRVVSTNGLNRLLRSKGFLFLSVYLTLRDAQAVMMRRIEFSIYQNTHHVMLTEVEVTTSNGRRLANAEMTAVGTIYGANWPLSNLIDGSRTTHYASGQMSGQMVTAVDLGIDRDVTEIVVVNYAGAENWASYILTNRMTITTSSGEVVLSTLFSDVRSTYQFSFTRVIPEGFPNVTANLIGLYLADLYTVGSRNWAGANITGSVLKGVTSSGRALLTGTENSGIVWPAGNLNYPYTLFHVARYPSTFTKRRRIITSQTSVNWFSGFEDGCAGRARHDVWVTSPTNPRCLGDGWVISTDQFTRYRAQGTDLTVATTFVTESNSFCINCGPGGSEYRGDWDLGEVYVYSRALSNAEIEQVESYLMTKYGAATAAFITISNSNSISTSISTRTSIALAVTTSTSQAPDDADDGNNNNNNNNGTTPMGMTILIIVGSVVGLAAIAGVALVARNESTFQRRLDEVTSKQDHIQETLSRQSSVPALPPLPVGGEFAQLLGALQTLSRSPSMTAALLTMGRGEDGTAGMPIFSMGTSTSPTLFQQDAAASAKVPTQELTISPDNFQQVGRALDLADARLATVELRGTVLPEQVLFKSRGRSNFSMFEYQKMEPALLESAISKMMEFSHLNVLALVAYCPQVKGIVTEHVTMPLDAAIQSAGKFKREAVQVLLIMDMTNALVHIHAKGFVHTSLYPENVFIKTLSSDDKPVACVGGFEWMIKQSVPLTRSLPVDHPSAMYAAPEVVQQVAKKSTYFMDIYSLGMLCHLVVTGKASNEEAVRAFVDDALVRAELRNLIKQCTESLPTDRLAIAQVQSMMTEIRNNTENLDDF